MVALPRLCACLGVFIFTLTLFLPSDGIGITSHIDVGKKLNVVIAIYTFLRYKYLVYRQYHYGSKSVW